jgi:AGCS family alanine or glycine:cation symporter
MAIFAGEYTESNSKDVEELGKYILDARKFTSNTTSVENYSGILNIIKGQLQQKEVTVFHNNSIAEDVTFYQNGNLFEGPLEIVNGEIKDSSIVVEGKSLIHSAELTSKAFGSGVLGKYGEYIVAIGLLLFAFSTAIAWSYYGDRSTAYIFGENAVPWYRLIYVVCFIAAAIIDTTVVWNIAYVVVALVTIPNLFALFILRKEMKEQVSTYVIEK